MAEADLRHAAADIGDWFRFDVGAATPVGTVGVVLPVTAVIGSTTWADFHRRPGEPRRRAGVVRAAHVRLTLAASAAAGRTWLSHHRELTPRSHDLAVQFPRLLLVQRHLQFGELYPVDLAVGRTM